MKAPFVIGRVLFGGFFLYNGIHHFLHTRDIAQYAGTKHVPNPDVAVRVTGAMLAIGGASILLGIKPKYGAAAIVAFLAGASPMIHNFWAEEDPQARQADMINFCKNLALLGAALALANAPVAKPTIVDRAMKTEWRVMAA